MLYNTFLASTYVVSTCLLSLVDYMYVCMYVCMPFFFAYVSCVCMFLRCIFLRCVVFIRSTVYGFFFLEIKTPGWRLEVGGLRVGFGFGLEGGGFGFGGLGLGLRLNSGYRVGLAREVKERGYVCVVPTVLYVSYSSWVITVVSLCLRL